MKYLMLTMEFSSYLLEIPLNDAYTTLSQNPIGCSTLSQDLLTLENNEKATLNILHVLSICIEATFKI